MPVPENKFFSVAESDLFWRSWTNHLYEAFFAGCLGPQVKDVNHRNVLEGRCINRPINSNRVFNYSYI